jgi:hypothetical protein
MLLQKKIRLAVPGGLSRPLHGNRSIFNDNSGGSYP